MLGHKRMEASDGYHTFSELYDHRITLFIALCRISKGRGPSGRWSQLWRSKRHSDGELCFGTGSQLCWVSARRTERRSPTTSP
jgi:hypothetical protein